MRCMRDPGATESATGERAETGLRKRTPDSALVQSCKGCVARYPPSVRFLLASLLAGALTGVQAEHEVKSLTLDALIARLPAGGEEWERGPGDVRTLHPVAAELLRRLRGGVEPSSEQWRRLLLDGGALRVRERWPMVEPLAVSAGDPGWLGSSMILVLEPLEECSRLRRIQVGLFDQGNCGTAWMAAIEGLLYQSLGELPIGQH